MEKKFTHNLAGVILCLLSAGTLHAQEHKTMRPDGPGTGTAPMEKAEQISLPIGISTAPPAEVSVPVTVAAPADAAARGPIHHSITALASKGVVSFFTGVSGVARLECSIVNRAGEIIAKWSNSVPEDRLFTNIPAEKFRQGGPFVWVIADKANATTERVPFTEKDCQPVRTNSSRR